MQLFLKDIQREIRTTFLFVTHDQEEAIAMADRICVMNFGRIQQLGIAAGRLLPAGHRIRRPLLRRQQPGRGPAGCAADGYRQIETRGRDPALCRRRAVGHRRRTAGRARLRRLRPERSFWSGRCRGALEPGRGQGRRGRFRRCQPPSPPSSCRRTARRSSVRVKHAEPDAAAPRSRPATASP